MKILLIKVGFICLLLTGCMNPKHLVYVHGTTMGLEVTASTETATGRLVFGYDRETFALIPRKKNKQNSEAMSLAAISCIYAQGLEDVQFRHFVSTGKTAVNIAQHPDTIIDIRKSIQGGSESCSPSKNDAGDTGKVKEEITNTTQGGK